jgi:predicted  nucleic acid-binding Zn-ribbon protein
MVLYKCDNCGYISDEKISVCPKCGSKKFTKLSGSEEKIVKKARKTNYLHMKSTKYLVKLKKYAEQGIKEDLDPACVKIFEKMKNDCYETYQMMLAEIATHVERKKWG